MKIESIDILKQKIIRTYRKHGDEPYLRTNARIYTGNEIAEEIEKETEFGVECVNKLIQLTIDLLARDKMKYEPKDTRSVYDCKHFDSIKAEICVVTISYCIAENVRVFVINLKKNYERR